MINLNGFGEYLRKIGFVDNSISFYTSHITTGLAILNEIEEFSTLDDIEKIKTFANKDNNYQEIYDNHHDGGVATFSDNRSVAMRYKYYLQYLQVIDTMKDYNNNPDNYPLNNAHIFYKVFDDNLYPVKSICKDNLEILELEDDFRTSGGRVILKKIFNKQGQENLTIVDKNTINNEVLLNKSTINIENIILYGAPGVGKTHNYQRLIAMIEDGRSQKEIFDIISKNEKVEHDSEIFKTIKDEKRVEFVTFHQSYSYEDFIEGFRPNNNGIKLEDGVFKNLVNKALEKSDKNFYIVIDEINRGNISKIFGELITLIEEDKRDIYEVTLPYSKENFSVPSNLYIIATMNSTDKSIATVDIALRRRFTFLKMKPNLELVKNTDAKELMEKLNEFIGCKENLGEDYMLGHSYFMKVQNSEDLEFVKEYKIKPLLEEYFYADDDKLPKVLAMLTKENN
ncbi:McrB family protein [Sulfurimonas sp.]|uniref:McrB family protein n=1 Tax=Sulfurimonas sp. TaxID=2022749 RepID=UPI002B48020C|nr:AAA family ATPase [Sulfurimonas sp.]